MSNRFIYFISIFTFSFSAYAAEDYNTYTPDSSGITVERNNPIIIADVKIDTPCTPSRTYQQTYTCKNGTRKTNTCTIYTNSFGAQCRETCEPQTCKPGE